MEYDRNQLLCGQGAESMLFLCLLYAAFAKVNAYAPAMYDVFRATKKAYAYERREKKDVKKHLSLW